MPENANFLFWRFSWVVEVFLFCNFQARNRPFTSAHARGTNPHAARARAILSGELTGCLQRLDGDDHTPTHNTNLKASEVRVVQIQFRQKKNPKFGSSRV